MNEEKMKTYFTLLIFAVAVLILFNINSLFFQKKGERFTAGNAWQLYQIYEYGKVDMSKYPKELLPTAGTWFDEFLDHKGKIKK